MHVKLDNARDEEQLKRMQRHAVGKRCHFCPEGFVEHTSPVIFSCQHWFITANDFPYQGSVNHFLIVLKEHKTHFSDLTSSELVEFGLSVNWLKRYLNPPGFSLFVRSGDMGFTGATLDHLHWHFVSGTKKISPEHPMIFGPLGYQKTPSST